MSLLRKFGLQGSLLLPLDLPGSTPKLNSPLRCPVQTLFKTVQTLVATCKPQDEAPQGSCMPLTESAFSSSTVDQIPLESCGPLIELILLDLFKLFAPQIIF